MVKKKNLFGVKKSRFVVYISGFVIGLIASIVAILFDLHFKNSVTSYFVGFAASLVVTDVFAYIVDRLNCFALKDQTAFSYITPLKDNITELFFRVMSHLNEKKEYSINDFKDGLVKSLDEYSGYLDKIIVNRDDLVALNMADAIKRYNEKRCIQNIRNEVDRIYHNRYELIANKIIDEQEMFGFEMMRDTLKYISYPFFDILEPKESGEKGRIIWPERHIDEIYKHNFEASCSQFVDFLIELSKNNKNFSFIKNLKLITNENELKMNKE